MEKNLKRNELMALGVHDLRNIARTVGVVGPTMKVKEQLVDEIIEIVSGKMQASKGVKRGRKAKANFLTGDAILSLPTELCSIIQAKEQKKHTFFDGNLGYLSLNQNAVSSLIEYVDKQGYLLCENGVLYFFDILTPQRSMVYVPAQLCEKFDLKVGDKVLAKCQKMPGNNVFLCKDVETINGCDAKNYKRNFCQFGDLAKESTKWFCDEVSEGDLKILFAKSPKDFLNDKKNLLEFCKNNNIFTLYLGIDCSLSEQYAVESVITNGEVIHIYSDVPEDCFEMMVNAVNNAIIRTQSGQKLLFIVYDFFTLFQVLQNLSKTTNISEKDLQEVVNKIQNLNRVIKNTASITTLIINK